MRRQSAVLPGPFGWRGLNALIVVTQLCLQTVPPHTVPDQPCHYNLSHISFHAWHHAGTLCPLHLAMGCDSRGKHELGCQWKAEMREEQKEENCRH